MDKRGTKWNSDTTTLEPTSSSENNEDDIVLTDHEVFDIRAERVDSVLQELRRIAYDEGLDINLTFSMLYDYVYEF